MSGHESLIEKAKQGNREALNKLFYDHADQLSRFVERRLPAALRPTVGVEDIQQETFRLAYSKLESFEAQSEGSSFFGWLRMIALNQIKDAVKSQTRKKRGGEMNRLSATPKIGSDSVHDLLADIADDDDVTATRKVARKEAVGFLKVAIASLDEGHQKVLCLRYVEGMSYDEIGEAIGKSGQAVKGLLRRAKAKLSDDLGNASAYLTVG